MSIDNDTDTPVRFGRPPNADQADFNEDIAHLRELCRQLSDHGPGNYFLGVFYGTPGAEVRTQLAIDMAAFELIGDDIAAWKAA